MREGPERGGRSGVNGRRITKAKLMIKSSPQKKFPSQSSLMEQNAGMYGQIKEKGGGRQNTNTLTTLTTLTFCPNYLDKSATENQTSFCTQKFLHSKRSAEPRRGAGLVRNGGLDYNIHCLRLCMKKEMRV